MKTARPARSPGVMSVGSPDGLDTGQADAESPLAAKENTYAFVGLVIAFAVIVNVKLTHRDR
jgi:hypothetical protein